MGQKQQQQHCKVKWGEEERLRDGDAAGWAVVCVFGGKGAGVSGTMEQGQCHGMAGEALLDKREGKIPLAHPSLSFLGCLSRLLLCRLLLFVIALARRRRGRIAASQCLVL